MTGVSRRVRHLHCTWTQGFDSSYPSAKPSLQARSCCRVRPNLMDKNRNSSRLRLHNGHGRLKDRLPCLVLYGRIHLANIDAPATFCGRDTGRQEGADEDH